VVDANCGGEVNDRCDGNPLGFGNQVVCAGGPVLEQHAVRKSFRGGGSVSRGLQKVRVGGRKKEDERGEKRMVTTAGAEEEESERVVRVLADPWPGGGDLTATARRVMVKGKVKVDKPAGEEEAVEAKVGEAR
jgi:hypothetical protein